MPSFDESHLTLNTFCAQLNGEPKKVGVSNVHLRLRRIGQHTAHSESGLDRLKRTVIGRLYVNWLKQIPFVRTLVIWVFRNLYPVYINLATTNLGLRASQGWFPLVKLSDYAKKSQLPRTEIFGEEVVETPVPNVIPSEDQAFLVSPHDRYVFPPVYIVELRDALVYGGTNLVFKRNNAICHDLYDFRRDYTAEELHCRHSINVNKMRIRLLHSAAMIERLHIAATFVDACAPNYAHWLTEVLPRIAVFCSQEKFANVPIIINDGLHQNILDSLAVVVGPEREVIAIPIGACVLVESLCVTSVTGYTPFEHRNIKKYGVSHGFFSSSALRIVKNLTLSTPIQEVTRPKKVYLRRNSSARLITNIVEIEKILLQNGYVVIEPEKLTFQQQVDLFRNVEYVIGAGGAAFANMIFAKTEASVIIMIGRHNDICYWYWQNVACASGKRVRYVLSQSDVSSSNLHFDFEISPLHLAECVQSAQS